jgi:hypothetical protein
MKRRNTRSKIKIFSKLKPFMPFSVTQGCHAITEGEIFPNLWIGKEYSLFNATALSTYNKHHFTSLEVF